AAREAASFRRYGDPQGLIEGATQALTGIAGILAGNYPNLAWLLRTPTPGGPPLLAALYCFFFRREVERNDELALGLFFDQLQHLSASQAKAFGEVNLALVTLGDRFDVVFGQLGRIEAGVVEVQATAASTHGAVLDIQAELQQLRERHLANVEEVRSLLI